MPWSVSLPSAREEQDSIFITESKTKFQPGFDTAATNILPQCFTYHSKWNEDPYPPTLLPWCPVFSTLDTCVATSTAWPAFVHPRPEPCGHFPKDVRTTNLNCRAHFSSIWTDPSAFSTGGLSFQSWGNLLRQPLPQNYKEPDCALKAWAHVGAPLSCMVWAEAWNVILQEEVQSFHQLTVIYAESTAPFLITTEGGSCLTSPLNSESKTQ